MGENFTTWWNNLGEITKYVALYVVAVSTGITVGAIQPAYLAVYLQGTTGWLQILYRSLTSAFCFGNFSMGWLMTVPTFISFLGRNEKTSFAGRPVDFIWMLVFLAYVEAGFALMLGYYWTNISMLLALCWVHCKRSPGERTSFFGFEFDAAYFPWVLVAFNFIVAQSIVPELAGIVAGHVYIFLQDVLPVTHGKRYLATPQWFSRLMTRFGVYNQVVRTGGFQAQPPPQRQQPPPAGGHVWGRGRPLGG